VTLAFLGLLAAGLASASPLLDGPDGIRGGGGPASEDSDDRPDTSPDSPAEGADDDGKAKKKKKKGKKRKGRKASAFGWQYQPYVMPGGGVQISEGGSSVVGGADAGVAYWRGRWQGDAYVGGSTLAGGDVRGWEAHVGTRLGVRRKRWGLSLGVEGFMDRQSLPDGTEILAPSTGVRLPVDLVLGPLRPQGAPRRIFLYAGVAPAFLADPARHAEGLPLGDEFEWSVGFGMGKKGKVGRVGMTTRITAAGTQTTPTATFTVR
jgi:hypothetical protein